MYLSGRLAPSRLIRCLSLWMPRDGFAPRCCIRLWRCSTMRSRTIGVGAGSPRRSPPIAARQHCLRCCCACAAAAAQFEAGTLPLGDEFRRLLEGSSRAGGARPKALVRDESGEWLAKFPSRPRDDAYDVVGLEATCLALARHAGLEVP